ncbi:putative sensor histidine kinase/response regulator [Aspergillus taichungensis]|uniref:histidine kinase n=1 Tax=Aspergillus taichungensis TaxID=482145 RepID=A0A2J5I0A4_9EURO|nr:putative sensor histidine kinase/response regulator [Aspergillus taichungensis]
MSQSVESEWSPALVSSPPRNPMLRPCKSESLVGDPAAAAPPFRPDDLHTVPAAHHHYRGVAENMAIERLVALKRDIPAVDPGLFWIRLMEQVTSICGAQYAFVARRVRLDEPVVDLAGRKPTVFGMAFYYNDGHQTVGLHRHRYFAGGNPLSHMDREKPCLVPDNLGAFTSFGADQLPFAAEGYLSVPLFAGTECVAHFGLMWSAAGLKQRSLPWSFMEMVLYSLEDQVVTRIGKDGHPGDPAPDPRRPSVGEMTVDETLASLAHAPAEFASQHLKPYARSLSHELRTPMQGIVGMLDVMHATVREALQEQPPAKAGGVFQSLKEGIEMVQDSARRAVEAADNVVHAYDLNMQVPTTPQLERDGEILGGPPAAPPPPLAPAPACEGRPNLFIEGSDIPANPYKRRRSNPADAPPPLPSGSTPTPKTPRRSPRKGLSPRSEEVKVAVHESERIVQADPDHPIEAVMADVGGGGHPRPSLAVRRSAPHLMLEGIHVHRQGSLRLIKLRDLLRLVINESLHVGGRPDFAVSSATDRGEKIEVRSRLSNGEVVAKTINWSVDPALPETLFVDDRDLAKLISCVFLNAVKFTNAGTINVCASRGGSKGHDILIRVQDTGPGIPTAFLPKLFKPFAREDMSTTRSKDGLGLGLLVAKGLARKMGGDLLCVRSATSGPDHGSEFAIRIPINPSDPPGRSASPTARLLTPPQLGDPTKSSSSSSSSASFSSASSSGGRSTTTPEPDLEPSRPTPVQQQPSPSLSDDPPSQTSTPPRSVPSVQLSRRSFSQNTYDSQLGVKHPLTFLVAEDNQINRRVLVNMLKRLGYHDVYEACNGKEAVRTMQSVLDAPRPGALAGAGAAAANGLPTPGSPHDRPVDVILMDLWMPEMDGYEATSHILQLPGPSPTVLAVSADVTDEALNRASKVGMKGYMTKPYKLTDLERLIVGYCSGTAGPVASHPMDVCMS